MFDFLQSLIDICHITILYHTFLKHPLLYASYKVGLTRGILGKYMTQCFDQKISL